MLKKANISTLEISRLRLLCCEIFKIVNNLSPEYITSMFTLKIKQINTRNVNLLEYNRYNNVNYGKKCFTNFSIHIWNNLPNVLRSQTDYAVFKKLINTWTADSCKCNYCVSASQRHLI